MKLTEETPIFKLIAEREHEFYLGNIKENIKQQILENQEKLEKIEEYYKDTPMMVTFEEFHEIVKTILKGENND
jgi:hypothetical protein